MSANCKPYESTDYILFIWTKGINIWGKNVFQTDGVLQRLWDRNIFGNLRNKMSCGTDAN